MLPPQLTIGNIIKGVVEFVVGFAQVIWVALIRPYPWFWLIAVVVLIAIRVLSTRRRR